MLWTSVGVHKHSLYVLVMGFGVESVHHRRSWLACCINYALHCCARPAISLAPVRHRALVWPHDIRGVLCCVCDTTV